jgi:hypothetical protein
MKLILVPLAAGAWELMAVKRGSARSDNLVCAFGLDIVGGFAGKGDFSYIAEIGRRD